MAGDWIKMRAALATDPKVSIIGKMVFESEQFGHWLTCNEHNDVIVCDGALRYIVTGALHAVWCAANEHAKDGRIVGAGIEWVDSICGVPSFGLSMKKVGWLIVHSDSIEFPKFDTNNTSAAERQKRYRKNKQKSGATRDVTVRNDDVTRVAPEKRREDKRRVEENTPPTPSQGDGEFFDPVKAEEASKKIVAHYQKLIKSAHSPQGGQAAVTRLLESRFPKSILIAAADNYIAWCAASGKDTFVGVVRFYAEDGDWKIHANGSPDVLKPKGGANGALDTTKHRYAGE